jgi:hypothetical protein
VLGGKVKKKEKEKENKPTKFGKASTTWRERKQEDELLFELFTKNTTHHLTRRLVQFWWHPTDIDSTSRDVRGGEGKISIRCHLNQISFH